MGIVIRSEQEIMAMRQAGRVVAIVLEILSGVIRPGMETKELDVIAGRLRDTTVSRLISVYR
jgi:methionine aminopeptidase